MKQLVRRLARSAGLSISRYPPPETLGHHLKQLTRRLDINCVLDVGAHEGGYARLLRKEVKFAGEIVSFEPAALGRTPGKAILNVFAESELNTLLAPSRYGFDCVLRRGEVPAA